MSTINDNTAVVDRTTMKRNHPGGKAWRKQFKCMINDAKKLIAENRTRGGEIGQDNLLSMNKFWNSKMKMATYAYYCDTKNTILEMKKFKVICQKESAVFIDGVSVICKRRDGTWDVVEGDDAYKTAMEQMGKDIEFYEELCRILIRHDINCAAK